ncbi:PAS/PAC sensor hybrid histidine kinase [Fibrisoma limi BUZ 3]|uniref:histidine kinase n=1 Tax=Fibrisoma limi BUZ 3 TaxID=1185876 RepID=I2GKY1_9BACT|nr:PAS domain S-box protein [Fibrisoma limi]CCH54557.1 PAS/PAC sensor hybrid histidine kinase [Fibrisoma limi BUZ 3]
MDQEAQHQYVASLRSTLTVGELMTLTESFAQAVWETDANGIVRSDSPSWRAYTGQSLTDWLGEGWVQAVHPDDQAYALRQWQDAVVQRLPVNAEFRLRSPDGGWRWTNVRATAIAGPDGAIQKWVGLNIDISERKQAEERLAIAEANQRAILDSANQSIMLIAPDFTIQIFNRFAASAAEAVFGTVMEVGQSVLQFVSDGDRASFIDHFQQALAGEEVSVEKQIQGINGSSWWEFFFYPILQADGKASGVTFTTRNISGRKQTEEVLRQAEVAYRSRIKKEVADRTAELKATQDLLRATLNSSLAMIQVFEAVRDEQGQIVDFVWTLNNHASEQYYGEVIGKSLLTLNPGVVEEGIFDTFKRVVETGVPDQSERHYVHEQFNGWFFQSAVKLYDGVATTTVDITERKQAQQDVLRLKEEIVQKAIDNYFALFNSIDEGFCTIEILFDDKQEPYDFRYLDVNPAFEKQTGMTEVVGKTIREVIPHVNPALINKYADVVRTGEPVRFSYQTSSGQWFELYATPTGLPGDHHLAVLFNDVTERVRADKAIRESEERLRLAMEAAEMYAWELDLKTRVPYFSDNFTNITGRVPLSRLEDNLQSVHPDDRRQVQQALTEAATNGVDRFTYEMRTLSANPGVGLEWFRVSGKLIRNEQSEPIRAIGVAQKITQRKAWEQALQLANERFTLAEEALDGFIYDWDIATGRVVRSEGFTNVLGYEQGEIAEQPEAWLALIHPDDRANLAFLPPAPLSAQNKFVAEYRVKCKDGQYSHLIDRGLAIKNEHGSIIRIIGISVNVTRRKRADANGRFLVEIADDFTRLSTGEEIIQTIGQKLAAFLHLTGYHYIAVNEAGTEFVVRYYWHVLNVPRIEGIYRIDDYTTPAFTRAMQAGEPWVINDAQNDPRSIATATAAINIGAYLAVPFFSNNRLKGFFVVTDNQPRQWTAEEIELVQEVCNRVLLRLERAEVEASLRRSEEKYRTIFNSIDEGFSLLELIFDDEGNVVDYWHREDNPSFTRMTGIENPVDRRMSELVPNLEAEWYRLLEKVYHTGEPIRIEYPVQQLGQWYTCYLSRVGTEGSLFIAAIYDDITQRRQLEQRRDYLLELNDALRSTADPIAIQQAVAETAMNFLGTDRCYYALIEGGQAIISRDAATGDLPSVAGVYPLSSFDIFRKVVEGGVPFVVYDAATTDILDEPLRDICLQLQVISFIDVPVIKEGRAVGIFSLVQSSPRQWTEHEIGLAVETAELAWGAVERANTEKALRDQEQRTRLAVEAAELATWEWNLLTDDVYWNDQHFTLLGMPMQTNPVPASTFISHIHPGDQEWLIGLLTDAISQKGVYDADFRVLREDGVVCWMSGYGRVTEVIADRATRMSGVMFDITERKQAEEALLEADRRKDEFMALLAHELRNPLATLSNTLLILKLTEGKDASFPLEQAIDMMSREMTQLVGLVDDLLDVSRINRGKTELRLNPLELGKLTYQAVEAARPAIERHHQCQLRVSLPDEPIYVDGDTIRLTQVIRNLLSNAGKFTPSGGHIDVSLAKAEKEAVLRIRDDGIGIPADQLIRIFDMFAQVDASHTRSQGGLGLGLTLVKQFIEMHRGRVEAYSEGPGKGSEFIIYLPIL